MGPGRGSGASSLLRGKVICVLRRRCCRQAMAAPQQLPVPWVSGLLPDPPAVLPRQRPPSRAGLRAGLSPLSQSHRGRRPRGCLTGRSVCLLCPLLRKATPRAVHKPWAPPSREGRPRRTGQPQRRGGRGGGPSGSALQPACGCGRRRAACALCGGPLSRVWPSRGPHTMITFLLAISRRGSRRGFLGSSCPPAPLRSEARGAFPRPRGPAAWTGLTSPSSAEAPDPPSAPAPRRSPAPAWRGLRSPGQTRGWAAGPRGACLLLMGPPGPVPKSRPRAGAMPAPLGVTFCTPPVDSSPGRDHRETPAL